MVSDVTLACSGNLDQRESNGGGLPQARHHYRTAPTVVTNLRFVDRTDNLHLSASFLTLTKSDLNSEIICEKLPVNMHSVKQVVHFFD